MFDRMLIPLDGSSRAELLLTQLQPLIRRDAAEVILIRSVYDPPSLARIDTAKLEKKDRAEAETYLHNIVRRLEDRKIKARGVLREEAPAEAILQVSAAQNVSLIAMATHGRSGIHRWIMGSITEKVLQSAEVPVLVVHSFKRSPGGVATPLAGEPIAFRSILVPLDGSENSMATLPHVEKLARVYSSEIVLLQVQPEDSVTAAVYALPGEPPVPLPAPRPDTRVPPNEFLELAKARLDAGDFHSRVVALRGDAPSQILSFAESNGIDLIALATHGRSGVSRWLLGSVTDKVLRASHVPMLVVRSKKPHANV